MAEDMQSKMFFKCRHCKKKSSLPSNFYGQAFKNEYLFKCTQSDCQTFFWHRKVLNAFDETEEPNSKKNLEIEEKLIKRFKIPKGYGRSVYVIKLSKEEGEEKESVYVGETGLHPLHRYLRHLRGYQKGKGHVTKRGKYLLSLELNVKDSKAREEELAKELESTYVVYGGH